jgi:hypothetical protein
MHYLIKAWLKLYYCPPTHVNQQGIDKKVVNIPGKDWRCEGDSSENPKRCLEEGQIKGLWVALFIDG